MFNEDLNKNSTSSAASIAGSVLVPVIMQFLTSNQGTQGGRQGGLAGLVQMFENRGMGNIASSWVSKGPNLPISGDQVQSGLGADTIQQLAAKAGIAPETAKSQIAEFLPGIVDQLTPNGTIPEGGLMEKAMDFMKSKIL